MAARFSALAIKITSFVGAPAGAHHKNRRGDALRVQTPEECRILAELAPARKRLEHAQRTQPAARPQLEDPDHLAQGVVRDHLGARYLGRSARSDLGALRDPRDLVR